MKSDPRTPNYAGSGKKCVDGEYTYLGQIYKGCISLNWHTYWCPTETDADGNFKAQIHLFGDCALSCVDKVYISFFQIVAKL